MNNLKQILLETDFFEDNNYLDDYVSIIESEYEEDFLMDNHHVIPLGFIKYRYSLKNRKAAEEKLKELNLNIIKRLPVKYHTLCHIYLALCVKEELLSYKSIASVNKSLKSNYKKSDFLVTDISIDLLKDYKFMEHRLCGKFNPMSRDAVKEKHDKKMRSVAVREKISNTMKKRISDGKFFTEEHRRKISESQIDTLYIHKNDITTRIHKHELDKYLSEGWEIGSGNKLSLEHKQALINSHLGKKYSDELRKKLSEAHKGQIPHNKGVPCSEEQKLSIKQRLSGGKFMNDGKIQIFVHKEDIDKYISLGYVFGKLPKNK